MSERVDLVPGTLDMMAMKAVSGQSLHGFGIARWVESMTGNRLTVEEGALYPALHRLEKRGWLSSDWGRTPNGRRARYYRLTDAGREELVTRQTRWEGSVWAVQQIMEAEDPA